MRNFNRKGFTLVELLVYVALFAIVVTLAIQFTLGIVNASARSNAKEEVAIGASSILQAFDALARGAQAVYDPTSNFIGDPGQLSLVTSNTPPPNEKTSYIDMYLDGGRFCVKREVSGVACVSSMKVEVTSLNFRKMTQAGGAESVQARFTIRFRTQSPKYYATQTFQTSARLRL